MGLVANGMALYGSAIPFTATFAVFSDFMKPALRLAALQKLKVVFVFTHDSVFVGEDGPTHQPVEQLAMCRSIPGLTVIRPADGYETAQAWAAALTVAGPVALFLTRQTVPTIPEECRSGMTVQRGAYVLSEDPNAQVIVVATGSEVMLAESAAGQLRQKGTRVRVVSMPSRELFESQDQAYRESVLPAALRKRVILEAAVSFGWEKYAGMDGLILGIDHFGDSAPYKELQEHYGYTPKAVAERIAEYLG